MTVAEYYDLDLELLTGPKRDRDVSRPRQIAMHLMRGETRASFGQIGYHLGGRDHTTILYGHEKISNQLDSVPLLGKQILEIRAALLGYETK